MSIPILIPAYNPDNNLIVLIKSLIFSGIKDIIVVDDGSDNDSLEIFEWINNNDSCHLCAHAVNLGKGRAIKTGLNFALKNFQDLEGIVTADADGQHSPVDILKVYNELSANPHDLILGCREFKENVPFRSKLGNETTKIVFHLLTGLKVSDTQTGLRGIPIKYVPVCLRLDGEKYEYEINMLISCGRYKTGLKEVPIQTIYLDQNRSSHFNPVIDSLKIYLVLFRFMFSSLSAALIDFVVFVICTGFGISILKSIIISRFFSGNYNFMVNKRLVFNNQSKFKESFLKYWLLVIILGSLSFFGISALVKYLNFNVYLAKVLVESLLYFTSFAIQRNLIFHPIEKEENALA